MRFPDVAVGGRHISNVGMDKRSEDRHECMNKGPFDMSKGSMRFKIMKFFSFENHSAQNQSNAHGGSVNHISE